MGKQWKQWQTLFSVFDKITADGDCRHEIKRCLLLGRKVTTNLDSILKSRHYFADKGPSSQSYAFSSSHVWTWEWKWKFLSHVRLFATPWTAAHQASLSNHQLLELAQTHVHQVSDAIQPSHPLSSPSLPAFNLSQLKLKLQYFGRLMQRSDSLEKCT